jgi:hypothetical protein
MFSVIFEVLPRKENWDDYLENAKMLRPELEQVDGFIDKIRQEPDPGRLDPLAVKLAGREVARPLAYPYTSP